MNDFVSKLQAAANRLREYYDVDKIKSFAMYVWEQDKNVFDITADGLFWYSSEHKLKPGSEEIIQDIIQIYTEIKKESGNEI